MKSKQTAILAISLLVIVAIAGYFFTRQDTGQSTPLSELSIPNKPLRGLFDAPGVMVVEAREYPWSALGRLNIAGRHFCNAVAVGADKILTPASCLYNKIEGKWFDNSEMSYVGAYQRDNANLNAEINSFEVAEGYDPNNKTLASITKNWALITLSTPIGNKIGWLGLSNAKDNDQNLTAGYRRGWEHALVTYPYCSVGSANKHCPNVAVDGLLNWFALNENQLVLSPPSGIDGIQDNWSLPADGQAPSETAIMTVPVDTVGRLLKEHGYLDGSTLSQESLKQALTKAEQDNVVSQSDSLGIETFYELIKNLNAINAAKTPAS
ncbi:trypsin-like serine peptidase [Kiloniella majae]|uniref:trypsin-like serine peptidase n=1 Tax=Kiloniella majae TaxID=1938558 RepID=UPI000A278754|nr:trypsin-like serine protease [Kiloniella majae]